MKTPGAVISADCFLLMNNGVGICSTSRVLCHSVKTAHVRIFIYLFIYLLARYHQRAEQNNRRSQEIKNDMHYNNKYKSQSIRYNRE